jgi:hypothetical protein
MMEKAHILSDSERNIPSSEPFRIDFNCYIIIKIGGTEFLFGWNIIIACSILAAFVIFVSEK